MRKDEKDGLPQEFSRRRSEKKLAGRRPARESLFGFMGTRKERGGGKITPPFF